MSSLSYDVNHEDTDLMKHFVGLTPSQFEKINYWNFGESVDPEGSNNGPKPEFTPREKLFICVVRLRRGFTLKTLAALLSSLKKKK